MLDAYSKVVLTVIAVALSTIAVQQLVKPANAFDVNEGPCGKSYTRPCWVKIVDF